jgi:hypothetical protein
MPATIDLRARTAETTQIRTEEFPAPGTAPAQPRSAIGRGKTLLQWEAPEYVVYKKTTGWYVAFGIILALLLFSAFLLRSFLTGVVFFLAGVLIFLYSERPPRKVSYEIRDTGIRIGGRLYLYRELAGFNMVERTDGVYMLLRSRRLVMPLIHVPLGDQDPDKARELLLPLLTEDVQLVEPLADILAHWLGF